MIDIFVRIKNIIKEPEQKIPVIKKEKKRATKKDFKIYHKRLDSMPVKYK